MKDLVEKTTKLAEEAEKHAKELEANAAKLEEATKAFADEAEKVVLEATKTGEKKRSKPEEPPNVERREGSLIKRTRSQWPWTGSGKAPEVTVLVGEKKTRGGDGYEVHDSRTCQCCGGQKAEPFPMPPHSQEELHSEGEKGPEKDIEMLLAELREKYGEGGYRTKPLSDVELLTLIAAEQRGEIAQLRQDFEEHQRLGAQKRASFWNVLETIAIATLFALVTLIACRC